MVKTMSKKKQTICASCEGAIESEDELTYGDEGTEDAGKPLHENCKIDDENEPCATVFPDGNEEDRQVIGHSVNETGGEFTVKYIRTDGWRGYYEAESKEYVKLHDDCALAYSEDQAELQKFDAELKETLRNQKVRFAVVVARTSNVFSAGVEYFVRKEDIRDPVKFFGLIASINNLKAKYRSGERFALTALTGKTDSSEFDEKDKLLLEASQRLEKGEEFENVKKDILQRAQAVQ